MSYTTLEEANSYVTSHYTSTDETRVRWESLIDDDKTSLLNKAFDIIDNLPYTGRKTCVDQPYAFPRCPSNEVPEAVKNAEVELALSLSDTSLLDSLKDYRRMVNYGISSYSIGNFSESLLTYQKNGLQLRYGLISDEAERLLTPWLAGGYRIG